MLPILVVEMWGHGPEPQGAAIVQSWLDAGYNFSHVEAGDLPPRPVE